MYMVSLQKFSVHDSKFSRFDSSEKSQNKVLVQKKESTVQAHLYELQP